MLIAFLSLSALAANGSTGEKNVAGVPYFFNKSMLDQYVAIRNRLQVKEILELRRLIRRVESEADMNGE